MIRRVDAAMVLVSLGACGGAQVATPSSQPEATHTPVEGLLARCVLDEPSGPDVMAWCGSARIRVQELAAPYSEQASRSHYSSLDAEGHFEGRRLMLPVAGGLFEADHATLTEGVNTPGFALRLFVPDPTLSTTRYLQCSGPQNLPLETCTALLTELSRRESLASLWNALRSSPPVSLPEDCISGQVADESQVLHVQCGAVALIGRDAETPYSRELAQSEYQTARSEAALVTPPMQVSSTQVATEGASYEGLRLAQREVVATMLLGPAPNGNVRMLQCAAQNEEWIGRCRDLLVGFLTVPSLSVFQAGLPHAQ